MLAVSCAPFSVSTPFRLFLPCVSRQRRALFGLCSCPLEFILNGKLSPRNGRVGSCHAPEHPSKTTHLSLSQPVHPETANPATSTNHTSPFRARHLQFRSRCHRRSHFAPALNVAQPTPWPSFLIRHSALRLLSLSPPQCAGAHVGEAAINTDIAPRLARTFASAFHITDIT